MKTTIELTEASKHLFIALANDAGNWGGCTLLGGNVGGSKEDRGNVTDLKRKGLIETNVDEGLVWIYFTPAGKELAASFGAPVHS